MREKSFWSANLFVKSQKTLSHRQHGPVDRCWARCHRIPVGEDRCGWDRTPGFVQVNLFIIVIIMMMIRIII